MSIKGNCWDNAVAESFFKTLKVERVYQTSCSTRKEAKSDLFQYIEGWYNTRRIHSANQQKSIWQAQGIKKNQLHKQSSLTKTRDKLGKSTISN